MSPLLDVAILRATAPAIEPVDSTPPVPVTAPEIDTPLPSRTPTLSGANTITANRPATVDVLAELLASNDPTIDTIKLARCDDVARRILREGGHVSMAALAREMGTTAVTLKRLMATKLYRRVYDQVSDELLGTIDERIADERLDVLVRGDSLQRRAMTVLHEALELSRTHMANVRDAGAIPRPGLLKVAVDAAAEVRQIVSARNATGKDGGPTVNINITRNHATVIQGAFRESGVDLTDVLGDMFNTPAIPTTATVIAKE